MLEKLTKALRNPPLWLFAIVGLAVFVDLASTYVRVWTPQYGITRLIMAGRYFQDRAIPVYRDTPKYMEPYPFSDKGFDGQEYAQIALDPLLRDPRLKSALDDAAYRARRILLPWLAWVLGLGIPFWVLNAYAGINLLFWILYAALLTKLFKPYGWAGLVGLAVMLPTCGIVECMVGSLTDFPSVVIMIWAMMIGGYGGASMMAAAILARETSIFGLPGLIDFQKPWRESLKRNLKYIAIAVAPFAIWFLYMRYRFPAPSLENATVNSESLWNRMVTLVSGNNIEPPLVGIMSKLGEFSVDAQTGAIRWNKFIFEFYRSFELNALLTVISVLTQCVYLLLHRALENRIWKMAIVYVPMFLCIGPLAWESHFTVTRHALPITLAFNLLLAMRPTKAWFVWLLLGNCFMPYGVYHFAHIYVESPKAPSEYSLVMDVPPASPLKPVDLKAASGWSVQEFHGQDTWHWSLGSAQLVIKNPNLSAVSVELGFTLNSLNKRDVTISLGDVILWSGNVDQGKLPVTLPKILAQPGDTTIIFSSPQAAIHVPEPTEDNRFLAFKVYNPTVKVSLP